MSQNTCGLVKQGGCLDPDIHHDGPCKLPGETEEQRSIRHARNLRKKKKYVARKKARRS